MNPNDVLLLAACGAACALVAVLLRAGRLAVALERQRLLAEQLLAGQGAEAATARSLLLDTERTLAARVGESRQAM